MSVCLPCFCIFFCQKFILFSSLHREILVVNMLGPVARTLSPRADGFSHYGWSGHRRRYSSHMYGVSAIAYTLFCMKWHPEPAPYPIFSIQTMQKLMCWWLCVCARSLLSSILFSIDVDDVSNFFQHPVSSSYFLFLLLFGFQWLHPTPPSCCSRPAIRVHTERTHRRESGWHGKK